VGPQTTISSNFNNTIAGTSESLLPCKTPRSIEVEFLATASDAHIVEQLLTAFVVIAGNRVNRN
jgi:hypothetical protein